MRLTLLPEYGSQFNFAALEIANESLEGIQPPRPSHQVLKLINGLLPALFLVQGRQRLIGHFESIL
jgi:hypothetical protein